MEERFLPIGIQDFEDLRRRNFLYVDKTAYVYKLATEGKPYFLSRPRRFGKSLFLSTLEAYFLGKKDLFKGLAIEKLEKDWIQYPVLSISFAGSSLDNTTRLLETMGNILEFYEKQFGIPSTPSDPSLRLKNLIISLYEKTGKQVVILIDEYDKPVLDALYTEFEERNRAELRNFYSPLKDCDKYIRFVFITGITKINQMNIFSGLNQLRDISMEKYYSAICGVSEEELDLYFSTEINELAEETGLSVEETRAILAKRYDGYHFTHDVPGVYNPFCLLRCLAAKDFGSYWFESGTPSWLIKTIMHQPMNLANLVNGQEVFEEQFMQYDPISHNMLPVIYQSGYLTIKGFERESRIYTLDFPNEEVQTGFLRILLEKYVSVPDDNVGLAIENIRRALRANDIEKVALIIKAAIADLPTIVKKDMCENYYESVVHLIFRLTGFVVLSELQSVCGRSDVVLKTNDAIFIFELKMDKGRGAEEIAQTALEQIDTKGYAAPFLAGGKPVHKVAFVFSSSGEGLVSWKNK